MRKSLFTISLLLAALLLGRFAVQAQLSGTTGVSLKIAFTSNRDGNDDIFVMFADGNQSPVNLTRNPSRDWNVSWSPDGGAIAFNSDREGVQSIWIMNQDGTNPHSLIPPDGSGNDYDDVDPAWSPNGTQIAFASTRGGIGRDLFLVDVNNPTSLTRLTNNNRLKGSPAWSSDSQWLAYWELESDGSINLFKIEVASKRVQLLISNGKDNGTPVWAYDNQAIYFDSNLDGAWGLYRIGINGEHPTRISTPNVNSGRASAAPDDSKLVFVTDRDQSDELYLMNPDGTGLKRLTDDLASDFSPAWQPAIPEGQGTGVVLQAPTPIPQEVTPTPPQQASFGQSYNGFDTHPISLETLKVDYGVSAWRQAGWTGSGVRIGVIDTGFGNIQKLLTDKGFLVTLKTGDDLMAYSNELNEHGTKVLEVVQAIAPDASYFVCRYDGTYNQLLACSDWMESVKVDIINHSAGLPALPLDGTNKWAEMASHIYDRGALWVNSAGNFNRSFLAANFTDVEPADGYHDFVTGSRTENVLRFDISPYKGNIILTWPQDVISAEGQPVDFDLEVVNLSNNQVIATSSISQRTDPTLPAQEVIPLDVGANTPWGIRILNQSGPLYSNVEMLLFVEFAPIQGASISGSVIAPADSKNVLTVGSVNGINELAGYSSRGVRGTNAYNKPDLSAPGEILLSNGQAFVGTSAASPVVAGIAALVLQSNPALFVDELRDYLINSVIPEQDNNFGHGILRLGVPPINPALQQAVNILPKTVWISEEKPAAVVVKTCPGALPPRLEIGAQGFVNYNLGLAIRAEPRQNSGRLANIYTGTEFKVIGGPVCSAPLNWWQVELQVNEESAGTGWLGEGSNYYLISPRILERAVLPTPYNEDCPLAPPTQLAIGDRAVIQTAPPGGLSIWRSINAKNLIAGLGQGTEVYVLGGPVCEGNNHDTIRWYVRVMNGEWVDNEGWISEAKTNQRWLTKFQPNS